MDLINLSDDPHWLHDGRRLDREGAPRRSSSRHLYSSRKARGFAEASAARAAGTFDREPWALPRQWARSITHQSSRP
jgi:hypothetical protein